MAVQKKNTASKKDNPAPEQKDSKKAILNYFKGLVDQTKSQLAEFEMKELLPIKTGYTSDVEKMRQAEAIRLRNKIADLEGHISVINLL